MAHAAPTACGNCVAMQLDQLTKFASVPDYRDPKAFKDEVEKEVNEIDTLWQSK